MDKSLVFWVLLLLCFSVGYAQVKIASKYSPIYENKTEIINVYKTITEEVPYSCLDTKQSLTDNVTCYKEMEVKVLDKQIPIVTSSKIIGYTDGQKEITGYVHEDKGIISKWEYPQNRNLKDYPQCVQYEIDKGFCEYV